MLSSDDNEGETRSTNSPALARLLEQRALQQKPFPLSALLQLYLTAQMPLYVNYFEGFQELIKWLGPIAPSTKPIHWPVPKLFLTYEMQEIARHTGNHISQIYQEFHSLWPPPPQI